MHTCSPTLFEVFYEGEVCHCCISAFSKDNTLLYSLPLQYCILFLQFRSYIIRVKEKQLFDNVFILSFITLCKFGTEEIPRNLFLSLCSHWEINAPCQKRSPVPQTKQCVQGDDKGFWSQKKKKKLGYFSVFMSDLRYICL